MLTFFFFLVFLREKCVIMHHFPFSLYYNDLADFKIIFLKSQILLCRLRNVYLKSLTHALYSVYTRTNKLKANNNCVSVLKEKKKVYNIEANTTV